MKINLTFSGDENILFMWPVVHCIMYLIKKKKVKMMVWVTLTAWQMDFFIHSHLTASRPVIQTFFHVLEEKIQTLKAADQRVLPNCSDCWEGVFKLMIRKTPVPKLGSDLWNKIKLSKSYAKQNSVGLAFGRRDAFSFFVFCFNNPFWLKWIRVITWAQTI